MFGGFFDMDKPFWRWVGKVPDIIALSFLWYVCCIPIVTIIPASCALFDAVSRNLMMDDKGCYKRFFRTFWRELKMGIPMTLLWLVLAAIAFIGDSILTYNMQQNESYALFSIFYRIMLLFALGYLGWLVPLESRYHQTFLGLHVNSLRFFLGRLPGTGLILLTDILVVAVVLLHQFTLCLIVVAPCLIAIFHSMIVEKAFMKAFPNDYEDGLPVYTEQDREAIKAIAKAKQEEAENAEYYE